MPHYQSERKPCFKCNQANPSKAHFCQNCGQSLRHWSKQSKIIRRHWLFIGTFIFIIFNLWWTQTSASPAKSAAALDDQVELRRSELALVESKASCTDVPYGTMVMEEKKELKDLPLNELIIALESPTFVEPPNPAGPTMVDIGLFVMEITEIDPSENTFSMEGFLDLVWCDPRLAFDPEVMGVETEIFLEKAAEKELEHIWQPDIDLVNEVRPRQIENEELIIKQDGTIEYREKFAAHLAAEYDLRRLPFDTQLLTVEIESFAWSSRYLQFIVEEDIVGFSTDFSIPEWEITSIEEHIEEKQEIRDRVPYSELITEITIQRDPGFFVFKIMIPLAIIVTISWAVFWMIGDTLADRMSVSFTGVLTSVAYQFIVSENVPRHVYNSYLDAMILFSFIMMALTIGENILVNNLYLHNNGAVADRIDRNSRWLFPVVYFGGLIILAVIYLL